MEYKILKGVNRYQLEEQVEENLNSGWKSQGGICFVPITDGSLKYYIQAMTKHSENLPRTPVDN